jgi:hypothetical protein
MMRMAHGLRALMGAAILVAAVGAAAAADEAVEAAFARMIESNEQVLDVLEAIDGPDSLAVQRDALIAALGEAEADAGEVTEYMAELPPDDPMIVAFGPQVEAHYMRRAEVQEAMVERLDAATLEEVEAILMGVR